MVTIFPEWAKGTILSVRVAWRYLVADNFRRRGAKVYVYDFARGTGSSVRNATTILAAAPIVISELTSNIHT